MNAPNNLAECAACGRWYCADVCPTCGESYVVLESSPPPTKYRNEPTTVDGIRFASKKEAERWGQLLMLQAAGAISELRRQSRFPLTIIGDVTDEVVGYYVSDFDYFDADGKWVVEDVKSPATRRIAVYRLKAKLMKAIHGIDIREV